MSDQCVCDNNLNTIIGLVVVNIAIALGKPFLYKLMHNKFISQIIDGLDKLDKKTSHSEKIDGLDKLDKKTSHSEKIDGLDKKISMEISPTPADILKPDKI